jgi:hypothetical protein
MGIDENDAPRLEGFQQCPERMRLDLSPCLRAVQYDDDGPCSIELLQLLDAEDDFPERWVILEVGLRVPSDVRTRLEGRSVGTKKF